MRTPLAIVFAVTLSATAFAQKSAPSATDGGTHQTCVDVEIDGTHSFGCLNDQLKRKVDQVNPVMNVSPVDAHSPSTEIGLFNDPAVREQYGQNYGRSVMPYRPPTPTFGTPVAR
jgi:hypothetical protein